MTDSDKCRVCGAERIGSGGFPHATKYACGAITTSSGHAIRNGECPEAHNKAIEQKKEKEEWIVRCAEWQDVNTELEEEVERLKGFLRAISDEVENYNSGIGQRTGPERLSRIEAILGRLENPSPEHGECKQVIYSEEFEATGVPYCQCPKCKEGK